MPLNLDDYAGRPYEDAIREIVDTVNEHERILSMDAELRARNPALQDAYEHYLTVKGISK